MLAVDAASADKFRTIVLAQRFEMFRTSVLEGRATQQGTFTTITKEITVQFMKFAALNTDKATRIYELRIAEVADKHRKEFAELADRLHKAQMFFQGPGFQALNELAVKHIKERSEIYSEAYIEALQPQKLISEEIKQEIIKRVEKFIDVLIDNENNSIRSRQAASSITGGIAQEQLQVLPRHAPKIKHFLRNKITLEIDNRNEKINESPLSEKKSLTIPKTNRLFGIVEMFLLATTMSLAVLWILDPQGSYEPWTVLAGVLLAVLELVRRKLVDQLSDSKTQEVKLDTFSPSALVQNNIPSLQIRGISIEPKTISDYGNAPYYIMVLFDIGTCPAGGFSFRLDNIDLEIEFYGGSKIRSNNFVESRFILPDNSPFFEKDNFQIKIKEPSPFYYFAHFSNVITSDIRSNPIIVKVRVSWNRNDWNIIEFKETVPAVKGKEWSIWQTSGYIDRRKLFG